MAVGKCCLEIDSFEVVNSVVLKITLLKLLKKVVLKREKGLSGA